MNTNLCGHTNMTALLFNPEKYTEFIWVCLEPCYFAKAENHDHPQHSCQRGNKSFMKLNQTFISPLSG